MCQSCLLTLLDYSLIWHEGRSRRLKIPPPRLSQNIWSGYLVLCAMFALLGPAAAVMEPGLTRLFAATAALFVGETAEWRLKGSIRAPRSSLHLSRPPHTLDLDQDPDPDLVGLRARPCTFHAPPTP